MSMVALSDIIDNIMLYAEDENHYLHGKSRTLVVKYAKRLVQELSYAGMKTAKLHVATIDTSLNAVDMPDDFVDYINVFYVINGQMFPAFHNTALPIDENGYVSKVDTVDTDTFNNSFADEYGYVMDLAHQTELFAKGYKYDRTNNQMIFDFLPYPNCQVAVEYISDPLVANSSAGSIEVNKLFEKAIEAGVYCKMIENLRDVPMYEKQRAKKEWNIKYRDAVAEMNAKPKEILQVLQKGKYFNF